MTSMSNAVANISMGAVGTATTSAAHDEFAREVQRRLSRLRAISHACTIIGGILLVAVALLALSATVVPRFMGLQSYAIVSGSMEPEFPVGSLVYAEAATPDELAVGEVAVFWRNDEVVIHRVEENHPESGELVTKGDANDGIDAHPALYENVIGRAVNKVPGIGYFIMALGSLPGKLILGWIVLMGAAFSIMGTAIASLARR